VVVVAAVSVDLAVGVAEEEVTLQEVEEEVSLQGVEEEAEDKSSDTSTSMPPQMSLLTLNPKLSEFQEELINM
jgi:hypothetical protein